LANDTDIDSNSLTAILVNATQNGSLIFNADGTFSYVPDLGFVGSDSFSYVPFDGMDSGNVTTVTIAVSAAPPSPPINPVDPPNPIDPPPPIEPPPPIDPIGKEDSDNLKDGNDGDSEIDDSKSSSVKSSKQSTAIQLADTQADLRDLNGLINVLPTRELAKQIMNLLMVDLSQELSDKKATDELNNLIRLGEMTIVFNRDFLSNQLNQLEDQIDEATRNFQFDLNMVITTTAMATTAGYILWTLRGGFLMATLLSSLPSWKFIDPLPILEMSTVKEQDSGESLSSILENSQ
jgi:hypothetical protein